MASSLARRNTSAPLLSSSHQAGLASLLSQTFNKPVTLNLTKLHRPHDDADILAQVVTQKIKDRKNQPRRVIRDAAWKSELPSQAAITRQQQELHARRTAAKPLTLDTLTHGDGVEKIGDVLKDMSLSQVSSVRVEAGGRLSKRITANRAEGKVAIRGATKKGPTHWVRGVVKANTAHALRAGKRRIGSYGVRITLGHS